MGDVYRFYTFAFYIQIVNTFGIQSCAGVPELSSMHAEAYVISSTVQPQYSSH